MVDNSAHINPNFIMIHMDDTQLLRYSRQILLPQIDISGQQQLCQARVLIIGVGGLGSPVALYLAAAGVGYLTLVDFDQVDLTNLQRQIIYTTDQLNYDKTHAAKEKLHALNPTINIITYNEKLTAETLAMQVKIADLIIDCSDNFVTRFQLNKICVAQRKPLISGAAVGFEGQISVFLLNQTTSPCYHCLYEEAKDTDESCNQTGVIAPLVGIIGSMQATEAIKILLNIGKSLCGKLLILNALTLQWRTLKLNQDPNCPVCGTLSLTC